MMSGQFGGASAHGRPLLVSPTHTSCLACHTSAMPHPLPAQMAAEGGQVGGEALLIADISQHSAEGWQLRRSCCGHWEACLSHADSQAQSLHGCGLATRVGACRAGAGQVQGGCRVGAGRVQGGGIKGRCECMLGIQLHERAHTTRSHLMPGRHVNPSSCPAQWRAPCPSKHIFKHTAKCPPPPPPVMTTTVVSGCTTMSMGRGGLSAASCAARLTPSSCRELRGLPEPRSLQADRVAGWWPRLRWVSGSHSKCTWLEREGRYQRRQLPSLTAAPTPVSCWALPPSSKCSSRSP